MNTSTTEKPSPAAEATPFDDGALYDLFFERLDLGLDFYLGLAQAAGGLVLDLACGTGRILLPCLKAGVDVDGLDLSPAMLARLRQKAAVAGFEPRLHQASMSSFRLPRRYALILITFNAFVHNLSDLFVRRPFRRAGLGAAALEEARAVCASRGVRAMLVETGHDNVAAQAVYRRAGFVPTDRLHLPLPLADPTHVG